MTGARPAEYLAVADVAVELNVSLTQMRALIRIGSLPATRNRRAHRLIERQMLERWISDQHAQTRRFVLEHDPAGRWVRAAGCSASMMPVDDPPKDEAGAPGRCC